MATRPIKQTSNFRLMLIALLIGAVWLFWHMFAPHTTEAPSTPDQFNAYVDCQSFVKQNLKAPSTAEFPSISEATIVHTQSNQWSVSSYVDAQNSFGAPLRSTFDCQVSYNGTHVILRGLRIDNP
jgi:hypothetical protein